MTTKSKVTIEEVKKIAELCKLTLSEDELADFSKIFTDTMEYINVMSELDLTDVKETFSVTGLSNVYQQGEKALNTLEKTKALQNASDEKDGLFATSGVFE